MADVTVYDQYGNPHTTSEEWAPGLREFYRKQAAGEAACSPDYSKNTVRPVAPGTQLLPGNVWVQDRYGGKYQTTPDQATNLEKYVNRNPDLLPTGYEWVHIGGQKIQARSDMMNGLNNPSGSNFHQARDYYSGLLSVHGFSQRTGDASGNDKSQETNNRRDVITGLYSRNPTNNPDNTPRSSWLYDPNPRAGEGKVSNVYPLKPGEMMVDHFYVPEGSYMQQQLDGVKVAVSESGEIGIYERLGKNSSGAQRYSRNPDTGALEPFILIGGASRNAAQSGMFGFAAGTPAVYGRGRVQYGEAGLITPARMAPEFAGKNVTGAEIYRIVEGGNAGKYDTSDYLSRLGAEAYGGMVQWNDKRTLGNITYEDRSNRAAWNLASYVDPLAVNRGKADLPGAKIPWSVGENAPAMFFMDKDTKSGDTSPTIPFKAFDAFMPSGNVSGIILNPDARLNITNAIGMGSGSPKKTTTFNGGGMVMGLGSVALSEPTKKNGGSIWDVWDSAVKEAASRPTPAQAILSGGLLGQWAFGDKSPEVIKGGIASSLDFITSTFTGGWTPLADRMRKTDKGLIDFRSQKSGLESELTGMMNFGKSKFGVTDAGQIAIDTTNPEAIAFGMKYDAAQKRYTSFMDESMKKGYVVNRRGSLVENPDMTYDYGEFTRWGLGAGKKVRNALGFNEEQLELYGMQLEQKKGIETIPEKLVFGTGYTLSTHPEKIASAYGAGLGMVFGGEILSGLWQGSGMAAAAGRAALAHPTAAAISRGAVGIGVPAIFAGLTHWSASEGLKASPEKTTINYGKMLPELAGVMYGGASGYAGLRAIDAGYVGFGWQKTTIKPEVKTIDLRQTLDLTPEVNLNTGKTRMYRPDNIASLAEQRMIISQYGLTPAEIKFAKSTGASLNDILMNRELTAPPKVKTIQMPKVIDLTELNMASMTRQASRTKTIPVIDLTNVQPLTRTKTIPVIDLTNVFPIQDTRVLTAQKSRRIQTTYPLSWMDSWSGVKTVSATKTAQATRQMQSVFPLSMQGQSQRQVSETMFAPAMKQMVRSVSLNRPITTSPFASVIPKTGRRVTEKPFSPMTPYMWKPVKPVGFPPTFPIIPVKFPFGGSSGGGVWGGSVSKRRAPFKEIIPLQSMLFGGRIRAAPAKRTAPKRKRGRK